MNQNQWLEKIPPNIGWYFSGFTDGEGSFNVSIKKVLDPKLRWRLEPRFNVSQRDPTVLQEMQSWLGCGTLRKRRDGVMYYDVTRVTVLKEKIIPFFERFTLISATKRKNFELFKKIIFLMSEGAHKNPEGFESILVIREKLNEGKGRKRKYNLRDVLRKRESSET